VRLVELARPIEATRNSIFTEKMIREKSSLARALAPVFPSRYPVAMARIRLGALKIVVVMPHSPTTFLENGRNAQKGGICLAFLLHGPVIA
jgi:hypothetical protein